MAAPCLHHIPAHAYVSYEEYVVATVHVAIVAVCYVDAGSRSTGHRAALYGYTNSAATV